MPHCQFKVPPAYLVGWFAALEFLSRLAKLYEIRGNAPWIIVFNPRIPDYIKREGSSHLRIAAKISVMSSVNAQLRVPLSEGETVSASSHLRHILHPQSEFFCRRWHDTAATASTYQDHFLRLLWSKEWNSPSFSRPTRIERWGACGCVHSP